MKRLSFCAFAVSCIFFVAVTLSLLPRRSFAAEQSNVKTTLASSIVVDPENSAQFIIDVTFTNVGENPTVLTSYDLVIGDVLPTSVSALAGTTVLSTYVREGAGSIIQVSLANSVLRPGMTFAVQVNFVVNHFMAKHGGTYDAELPLFRQTDTATGESVTFMYPESFGRVNYTTAPYQEKTANSQMIIVFSELESIGRLYLSVGASKYISVSMERSFTNETGGYVKHEVLIPPEFSSQHFVITSISPSPENTRSTEDGNYILTYSVPGNDTLWVRVVGILIEKYPEESLYELNDEEREFNLSTESKWWNIEDEKVLNDVERIANLSTLDEKVDWIYQYTQDELILSSGFRQLHGTEFRKGASVALKTYKNASVEDYADVFVALARYAGIPARVVAGYVFPYSIEETQLGMFHVWPQYWSSDQGWVSVDPAYEMYTGLPTRRNIGINRVVVVSAYDQETQGSFQETSSEFILTDQTARLQPGFEVDLDLPSRVKAGSIVQGSLKIRNTGNCILSDIMYAQNPSDEINVHIGEALYREVLVPGQVLTVPFTIDAFEWFENGSRTLSFSATSNAIVGAQNEVVSGTFSVDPLWWVRPVTWLITIMAFLVFLWTLWSGAKIGSWFLHLFKKEPESTNVGRKIIS